MCVLSDVALKGLFLTSISSPLPNPVFATKGERSETLFLERYRFVKLVKPDSADMSDMTLVLRFKTSRLVKPDSADTSEIALWERCRYARLVKLVVSTDASEIWLLESCRFVRLIKPDSADTFEI